MKISGTAGKQSSITRRVIPGLLLGLLVVIGLGLFGDLRLVGETIRNFDWRVFPIAMGFTFFNYSLRFLKWHYYLHQIGAKNVPWWQSLRMFVAGFPLAVTPGKVGEVLKGVWVEQMTGVPAARGVSVVVAERISDGLALLALSTLGVLAYPQYWPAFVVALVVLVGAVIISQIRPLALWFLALGERLPGIKRVMPTIREFYEGSFAIFRPQATFFAVALGTISWVGEGVGFYYILQGLGLPAGSHTLGLAIFILAFSVVVGAISALPGGLGASEASIAAMLALLAGVDAATASAATLLIRLATLWFGVSLGLFTWIFSRDLLGFKVERSELAKS